MKEKVEQILLKTLASWISPQKASELSAHACDGLIFLYRWSSSWSVNETNETTPIHRNWGSRICIIALKKKLLSDPTWPFCKSPDHICLHKSKSTWTLETVKDLKQNWKGAVYSCSGNFDMISGHARSVEKFIPKGSLKIIDMHLNAYWD